MHMAGATWQGPPKRPNIAFVAAPGSAPPLGVGRGGMARPPTAPCSSDGARQWWRGTLTASGPCGPGSQRRSSWALSCPESVLGAIDAAFQLWRRRPCTCPEGVGLTGFPRRSTYAPGSRGSAGPQNDPLVTPIILNTDTWGFEKRILTPSGVRSQQPGWGGWLGEVRGKKKFHALHTYVDSPYDSEHFHLHI